MNDTNTDKPNFQVATKSAAGSNSTSSTSSTATQPKQGIIKPTQAPPFKLEAPHTRRRHLKVMIYGNYGTGKTTLAGTAANVESMRDVLVINAESGDLALTPFQDRIDTIQVTEYKRMSQIKEFLTKHCKARDAGDIDKLREMESYLRGYEVETPKQYNTAIIDSLSEVEQYCMNQLLGITDTTKLDEEVQSAEWSEYKRNHSMIQRLVRAFRDLPMHVIFICGEQFNQDEAKRYKYSPALTGKLSKQVQGFMDMVGYLAIGNPKDDGTVPRRLYVLPTGKYDAKHRYANFHGSFFDDPSMESILEQVGLLNSSGAPIK